MSPEENNQEEVVDSNTNEGEGSEPKENIISLSKEEYDKLQKDLGSAKRELKDLKKEKDSPKETPQETKPDDALLQRIERLAFKQEGVTHEEDKELARNTAKKWGMDIDEVLADEDFKTKLEKQQTSRANVEATSNVKGGSGQAQAKNTTEYWQKKGAPPTPADVPDGTTRRKIVRDMLKASKGSGKMKFYNS
jgi:hypothetical protein